MSQTEPAKADIDRLYDRLNREAESFGYHLNPDADFTRELVKGILINQARYGYWSCPCRLASGKKEDDLDIICPCDYRDPDLNDYDTCYCALYVSGAALRGEKKPGSIPERRPPEADRKKAAGKKAGKRGGGLSGLTQPVWRCQVCGYLCAREQPPEVCPICKAKKERFERFI